MFTNVCIPRKAELFRSRVGTEREESGRERGRQRGARGQGAASSELRQKTKIRTENSIWSTTSESARGMSPFRFGTVAEHASARRGKFPFRFGKSSEHPPELHGNVPFQVPCTMSEYASDRRGMSAFRFGTASGQAPSGAECPFQVWEG
ncbi:unnamed protein product [Sphagnum jensenii]|uniref:Uncharacterized protein n=1 Tax=Sphagnum jensenii TaxID=128206 RepID=A0ABP0VY16_9BRYO